VEKPRGRFTRSCVQLNFCSLPQRRLRSNLLDKMQPSNVAEILKL
jgi:hypothetical protein